MSVTTTQNSAVYNTHNVLADYEIHHSVRGENTHVAPPPEPHPAVPGVRNPDDWPTDRRRIPDYRPINYELDMVPRRTYQNPAEGVFVYMLFLGVRVESNASKIWHATMGKFWDVGYKIGGEW
ncbi:hypothetical protein IWX49DRAFT_575007 [Phyllosticta citricarpa]|uniref:Uncharacterized protein n=1 Tax=Phyllosticta citriasiana TaxID=595635 RepID=A0ABR1K9E8_9PEZI